MGGKAASCLWCVQLLLRHEMQDAGLVFILTCFAARIESPATVYHVTWGNCLISVSLSRLVYKMKAASDTSIVECEEGEERVLGS